MHNEAFPSTGATAIVARVHEKWLPSIEFAEMMSRYVTSSDLSKSARLSTRLGVRPPKFVQAPHAVWGKPSILTRRAEGLRPWEPDFSVPLSLGSPVVPFCLFPFWVPLLKPNSRKKGTLIIKGPLGNLAAEPQDRTLRVS